MLEKLTREDFEALIGQKFTLTASEGQTHDFSLVDVVELPAPRARGRRASVPETIRRAPFSVFFQAATLLPQSTYEMRNEAFGAEPLTIFIVPVGEMKEGGYEYEAIFT